MWNWQWLLALLALAWALQCVGTLIQVRRYREVFRELSAARSDGWMGVGRGGSRWQAGAIVLAVVAPDETLSRAVVIRGRTVFAKAVRLSELEGRTMASLRQEAAGHGKDPTWKALTGAFEQIDLARSAPPSKEFAPDAERAPA